MDSLIAPITSQYTYLHLCSVNTTCLKRKAGIRIPKMPERFASIQKKSFRGGKFTFIVRKLKL